MSRSTSHLEPVGLTMTAEAPLPPVATLAAPDLRAIVQEHAAFLLRTVRRLGVAELDVEDVAQEVLVIVHRKLAQYDARCSMRGWIFGIASRVSADYRRSARVRRERVSDPMPETSVAADQEDRLERSRARALLDRALDELDQDKRAVFVLYELEGLEMQEVAEMVGCPVQTAYSRLHAARDRIRERLERALGERKVRR
jgi:RNA polymerase sigma-70 factor, ECF subfamily